jgi:adenosine deaminase
MHEWIDRMPKVELHLHIEGTLEPELMFALAQRHGVTLAHASVEQLRAAYAFDSLQSFLDLYYQGADVLRDEQDFFALAWAYLRRAAADRVRHVELFFDPQTHTDRGIPLQVVLEGLSAALARARSELDMSAELIACVLRHLPEAAAEATLDELLRLQAPIIGLGLDSSERGHPPEQFTRVFARARAAGLHVVAHAGEEGPPDYIRQALELLHVERIDHGVRCLEDPALVERLVERQIPLTVCPLSNVALRVFDRLADHNLVQLLDRGIRATVNSDDPAYFGGYIAANLHACADALPLGPAHLHALARNAVQAAFVSETRRAQLAREVDQWITATPR